MKMSCVKGGNCTLPIFLTKMSMNSVFSSNDILFLEIHTFSSILHLSVPAAKTIQLPQESIGSLIYHIGVRQTNVHLLFHGYRSEHEYETEHSFIRLDFPTWSCQEVNVLVPPKSQEPSTSAWIYRSFSPTLSSTMITLNRFSDFMNRLSNFLLLFWFQLHTLHIYHLYRFLTSTDSYID